MMDSSSIKLELLKNKKENAQSAIASQEVREHLAGFIRSKRQGSINQINNLQQLTNQQSATGHNASNNNNYYAGNLITAGVPDDDHPLRKTASMPIMHIPYKAQSLSKRRQMARRTTMSPLMKRNSRPKRQLLHSQDSNSAEYSSNPCIIQSTRAAEIRALSRSSSPQPYIGQSASDVRTDQKHQQLRSTLTSCSSQSSIPTSIAQTIKLSSIFTNSELERLQNNLKSNLYFPVNVNNCQKEISACVNSNNQVAHDNQSMLRQQQHMKVNEVIRKTVIQRASSRSRILGGGSLDIEASSSTSTPTADGRLDKSDENSGGIKDELRQWSLDGADPRTNAALSRLSTNNPISTAFHRELHKRRLTTTSDAASLRRSQSPCSSISMGLCAGQAPVGLQQPHNNSQYSSTQGKPINSAPVGAHSKHYSSSSSSTSSLLSQQDSFDDSSSQAIDLSSSSERQRNQQQASYNASHGMTSKQLPTQLIHSSSQQNQQNGPHQPNLQQQQQHCQKVLQESFKQLQLCQQQSQEEMQQLLLSSPHLHLASSGASGSSRNAFCSSHHQAPLIETLAPSQSANIASDKLDLTTAEMPNANLSQEQHSHHPKGSTTDMSQFYAFQQQAIDFNQWLINYKNIIQSGSGNEQQMTNSMITKIANSIPEPYRSGLIAQLISQQHQQVRVLESNPDNSMRVDNFEPYRCQQTVQEIENRSFIGGRTLSSPVLIPGQVNQTKLSTLSRDKLLNTHMAADRVGASLSEASTNTQHDRQSVGMLIDDDNQSTSVSKSELEKTINNSSLNTEENNNTLDLTMSNRSNEERVAKRVISHELNSNNKKPLEPSARQANYSFIYNPKFDRSSSTGLIYDLEMCNHKCICGNENNHPENSYRILAIWRRLYDKELMSKCALIEGRKANLEEIQLCHSETYSHYFGKSPYERIKLSQLDLSKLPIEGLTQLECGGQGADIDTAWNEEQTPGVARLAAGCVIEAAVSVAAGKLMNAFAIVRPPGHHAEFQQSMGFCFFNSVSIAARVLISRHRVARVLIVDWDVHHGNGIQKLFYEDKRVMYISLHRHDKGNFFPGTGDTKEIGFGPGEGYNWNIAWSNESMGDAEYLAAFRSLVMPIAIEFNPSMVLVACGFDAARGHPFNFGGYELTPACFAYMTRQLMSLADGRLVLCLEGGYELNTICDCAESCVRALLNEPHMMNSMDQISESELKREPNQSACEVLNEISNIAVKYWPSVGRWRSMIEQSALEAANLRY